jgi:hypothetical protein
MPTKPARSAKAWNPITALDDRDQGEYEVSDGVLILMAYDSLKAGDL